MGSNLSALKERKDLRLLGISLLSAAVALLVGALVLRVAGYSVVTAYVTLVQGAFGDMFKISDTLGVTTPLILTGLAVTVAIKGGVINIGAEGQMFMGALAAAYAGVVVRGLPPVLHVAVCVMAAMLAGGLWAMLAGWLKVKLNVSEVVLTIMLNYVAIFLTDFIVTHHFYDPGAFIVRSPDVLPSAVLQRLYPHSRLTAGFFIALAVVVVVWFFLGRTNKGFEIRAVGGNIFAAEAGGVLSGRSIVQTMFISGTFAGIAGAVEVLGVYRHFVSGFSPGYGFDGLAIAMLGHYNAFGVALGALFIGALRSGAMMLDRTTHIPADFVIVIQAVIIAFVATPRFIDVVKRHISRIKRKEASAGG